MPPITTIRKIIAQQANSQAETAPSLSFAAAAPTFADAIADIDNEDYPEKSRHRAE
jgi:hypothetical protein